MKNRNPILVALFSLITLGIYFLYWLVVTKNEMNKKGAKIPTIWLALFPLMSLLGIGMLQILIRFTTTDPDGVLLNIVNAISVLISIISFLAILPAAIFWFYKYSLGVEKTTKGKCSFSFCFWLGIILSLISVPFIWVGIIQNEFNKLKTSSK